MSDHTIYLGEGEDPPNIVYIVWGDPEDSFITEYRPPLHMGSPLGTKQDGTTGTSHTPAPSTYGMYTPEGEAAVTGLVRRALAEIGPADKYLVLSRCARILRDGIQRLSDVGHREVSDTAVREVVYGTVGKALVEQGYTDDRWDWES